MRPDDAPGVRGASADALPDALRPDWPVPDNVSALMSTRSGGVSAPPFHSLNLRPPGLRGDAVDAPTAVEENARRFAAALQAPPVWLDQVHGADVVRLTREHVAVGGPAATFARADASVTSEPGVGCVVLVADCLPVLLCDRGGRAVGAAHAGWRGLVAGVVERSVAVLCEAAGCAPGDVMAWLGACIGPDEFEVGADVLEAFGQDASFADPARFVFRPRPDGQPRWRANLPLLARDRLAAAGVNAVYGGSWCTVSDRSRFFSYRRDGRHGPTGRMAAGIALLG